MDIEHNTTEDLQDEDFQILAQKVQMSNQQIFFDNVVALLEQTVISAEFQKKIQSFIKDNWQGMQDANQVKQKQMFQKFSNTFLAYLNEKISSQISNFNMTLFFELLQNRKDQVDDQLLDTLQSMTDINSFNSFMRDCKTSHDEIQTYKVLTIKSNKIPESKTVKGKDNIFGVSNTNPLFDTKMKKFNKPVKQQTMIQKTQDELMVPDLVLTVKGIRKN